MYVFVHIALRRYQGVIQFKMVTSGPPSQGSQGTISKTRNLSGFAAFLWRIITRMLSGVDVALVKPKKGHCKVTICLIRMFHGCP